MQQLGESSLGRHLGSLSEAHSACLCGRYVVRRVMIQFHTLTSPSSSSHQKLCLTKILVLTFSLLYTRWPLFQELIFRAKNFIIREDESDYAKPTGLSAPRVSVTGAELPTARYVSAVAHRDLGYHDHAVTVYLPAWGQLIDHDMTQGGESKGTRTVSSQSSHRD